jgi:hypothetical protein
MQGKTHTTSNLDSKMHWKKNQRILPLLTMDGNANMNCIKYTSIEKRCVICLFLGTKEHKNTYEVIYKQNNRIVDDVCIC